VGERGEVRLFVSKLGIRVGGSLQMYETVQRQGDGRRLQRRNEGLCGGMRKGPVCSAVSGPAVQGSSVSEGGERVKQREGQEDEGEMFRAGVWKVLLQEARNEGEGSKWLAVSDGT
jgi:hypothetical protein